MNSAESEDGLRAGRPLDHALRAIKPLLSRWFVGLSMDAPVWDTKNRDRLLEGDIATGLLTAVMAEQPWVGQLHRLISPVPPQSTSRHCSPVRQISAFFRSLPLEDHERRRCPPRSYVYGRSPHCGPESVIVGGCTLDRSGGQTRRCRFHSGRLGSLKPDRSTRRELGESTRRGPVLIAKPVTLDHAGFVLGALN
ncbi:MAG: hypothetical protein JO189_13710 [Deltaproteobacteria bacterium]|nr:hypothetical protein [Deltaproteobacteria bacterium]